MGFQVRNSYVVASGNPVCHCERSAAISLGKGTLLREKDRHVASLLAVAKRVHVSYPAALISCPPSAASRPGRVAVSISTETTARLIPKARNAPW